MSDEKKQSKESQADSSEKATQDLQAKLDAQNAEYKTLQDNHRKAVEQLQQAQGTLDALDQYGAIDWAKLTPSVEPEKKEEAKPPTVPPDVQRTLNVLQGKVMTLQFRLEHPDLKDYEDDLVAPFVFKARQQNPRKSQDEILKIAADDVRGFLKKHEETILNKQKKAKQEQDIEKASGLDSDARTTPENEINEDEARQNYVNYRRKVHMKRTGQVA